MRDRPYDDASIAGRYAEAVARQRAAHEAQQALMRDNVAAYDRYFDFATATTPGAAREFLPREAGIVDSIEAGALAIEAARRERWEVLVECLMEKVRIEAARDHGADPGALIAALGETRRFRIESLDGVDGRFDELAEQGLGFLPKDRNRLLNRLVRVWAAAAGTPLRDLGKAMESRSRPDPSGSGYGFR